MGRLRLVGEDELERRERRAGREQCQPVGASVHRRVAASCISSATFGLRFHPLDVLARVHPQELVHRRLPGRDDPNGVVEPGRSNQIPRPDDPGGVVDMEIVLDQPFDGQVHGAASHVVCRKALVPAEGRRHVSLLVDSDQGTD